MIKTTKKKIKIYKFKSVLLDIELKFISLK
jgi:hypothetical protein